MSEIHVSREDAKGGYRGSGRDCGRWTTDRRAEFGAPLLKDGLQRVVNKHTNFASSRLRVHQQEAHKGVTH